MQLTPQETALAQEVNFDQDICLLIKSHANKKLERLQETFDYGKVRPGPGVSVAVNDGEEAERLINALRDELSGRGYRAFWSKRYEPDGMEETDEVAILKTDDPYAMIKLCQSDGANYDVSTEDIIDRLSEWKKRCDFEVVGASRDWVALQFSRLPADICQFAEDVYLLCPDTVGQGVSLKYGDDEKRIEAARQLCPNPLSDRVHQRIAEQMGHLGHAADLLPPGLAETFGGMGDALRDEVDTGIRLLAYELRETKFLFLWWD